MSAILSQLLSDLDIAVLERKKDGTFTLISSPPAWLLNLWPELGDTRDAAATGRRLLFPRRFPFAQRHVLGQSSERTPLLKRLDRIYTQDGSEQMLEALALFVDGHPLLMLRVPYQQKIWPIYQQAREQRLEYEQLIDEINKREVLLHCIVHDLSNPLAGIKGSLKLLQTEELVQDDGSELLRIGLRQAAKMQNLIGSILSTFANEVKPIVPTLIGADIAPDIYQSTREVVQSLAATAALKGVTLNIQDTDEEAGRPLKVIGEA